MAVGLLVRCTTHNRVKWEDLTNNFMKFWYKLIFFCSVQHMICVVHAELTAAPRRAVAGLLYGAQSWLNNLVGVLGMVVGPPWLLCRSAMLKMMYLLWGGGFLGVCALGVRSCEGGSPPPKITMGTCGSHWAPLR